jgi:thiol-disulfide isomerase/thioredoxin
MPNRLPVAAGLVSGILVAALVIGGIVAFAPEPIAAEPSPTASPAPTVNPSASASPSPDGVSAEPSVPSGAIVTGFHIGEPAPPLVVPQVGGGTIDLAALRGSPVWVNFMGTYCAECIDEFPRMNGFAVRYADAGLVVLAIDVREDEGTVAAFGESLNATFPLGLDLDGSAQRAWEAFALPIHFWVDAEGIIRDGALGGIGPDIMARGVARIMPGVEVTP